MGNDIQSLLSIDPQSKKEVSSIFDSIAKSLLNDWRLKVNDVSIQFTELEFYLFKKKVHEDNYTPSHKLQAGRWRFHNKGLNLTFGSTEEVDGGILIRGIRAGEEHINGPYSVIRKIFSLVGDAGQPLCLSLEKQEGAPQKIIKTFRNLRGKKVHGKYHKLKYRYFGDFEHANIPASKRKRIEEESTELS